MLCNVIKCTTLLREAPSGPRRGLLVGLKRSGTSLKACKLPGKAEKEGSKRNSVNAQWWSFQLGAPIKLGSMVMQPMAASTSSSPNKF